MASNLKLQAISFILNDLTGDELKAVTSNLLTQLYKEDGIQSIFDVTIAVAKKAYQQVPKQETCTYNGHFHLHGVRSNYQDAVKKMVKSGILLIGECTSGSCSYVLSKPVRNSEPEILDLFKKGFVTDNSEFVSIQYIGARLDGGNH